MADEERIEMLQCCCTCDKKVSFVICMDEIRREFREEIREIS